MTLYLLTAVLFILGSAFLMYLRFGRSWVRRPYGVLVLVASVYQGVSEAVLRISGGWDLVEANPPIEWADQGLLLANASMLICTVVYCLVPIAGVDDDSYSRERLIQVFDWRVLGALLVPLFVATSRGEGYALGRALDVTEGDSTLTALAVQLFVPLVVFTGFGLVLRYPRAWILVISVQALTIAIAGQRLEILAATVTTLLLLRVVGVRHKKRHIAAAAGVAVLLVLSIGGIRASDDGRGVFGENTGAGPRIVAILSGASESGHSGVVSDNPVLDAAARLNSIPWAGHVSWALEGRSVDADRDALTTSVMATLPTVIYPEKSSLHIWEKSPEQYAIDILGVPNDDYLPGHFTYYMAVLTILPQLVWAGFFGLLLGLLDRFALGGTGPLRVFVYGFLVMSALFFEKGAGYYFASIRSAILLATVLGLLMIWRSAVRGRLTQDDEAIREKV